MFENIFYAVLILMLFIAIIGVILSDNLVKKVLCFSSAQVCVILFFIAAGYKDGEYFAPIYQTVEAQYVNPVPHVLMLTAIVVGFAVTAFCLALILKIKKISGFVSEKKVEEFIKNQNYEF